MKPRYELRFLITPEKALHVRDFVSVHMELDEKCFGKRDSSYSVHTIHLDSDDEKLCWQSMRRDAERWILRLRYYDDHPGGMVFCEANHQIREVVVKHRSGVTRDALREILDGQMPPSHRFKNGADEVNLQLFVRLLVDFEAKPKLHIHCLREAYDSYDGRSRVTFDTKLRAGRVSNDLLTTSADYPAAPPAESVLLELRFIERFPHWYRDMVETLALEALEPWTPEEDCLLKQRNRLLPANSLQYMLY